MGIPGNEIADEEAKAALEDDLLATEKYPTQDLINWWKDKKTRKTRWQNSNIAKTIWKIGKKRSNGIDTEKMKRRDQVVISRLKMGYTMATHGYIINKQDNNECWLHFMRLRSNIQNNIWDKGKDGIKQIVEYF
jgi:hypothetical protein